MIKRGEALILSVGNFKPFPVMFSPVSTMIHDFLISHPRVIKGFFLWSLILLFANMFTDYLISVGCLTSLVAVIGLSGFIDYNVGQLVVRNFEFWFVFISILAANGLGIWSWIVDESPHWIKIPSIIFIFTLTILLSFVLLVDALILPIIIKKCAVSIMLCLVIVSSIYQFFLSQSSVSICLSYCVESRTVRGNCYTQISLFLTKYLILMVRDKNSCVLLNKKWKLVVESQLNDRPIDL